MTEDATEKERMLEYLDHFRRRVETGEITGIVMVAQCNDDNVLNRRAGEWLSSDGVLVMQRIASVTADVYLDGHQSEDDEKPRLRATEKEEEG